MNVKNREIYSDKFVLRVLNLKTLEDDSIEKEPADLYYWAKLFKATTWEEVKLLASQNPDFEDTIVTMKELSADEQIGLQCIARECYEWDMVSATAKGKRKGEEIGLRKGRAKGKTEGRAEGEQHLAQLIQKLSEEGLTNLISKVCIDSVLRQELYEKYNF